MRRPHRSTTPRPLLAVAGLSAIVAAIPVVYIAIRAGEAGPDGILEVLTRPRLPMLLLNTVVLSVSVTLASTVFGVATALALARVRLPTPRLFAVLAVLPLAVPSYLTAFGWLSLFPHLNGFWAAWLVLTVVTVPYVTIPVAAALRSTAAGLTEVSHTLGNGQWRTFRAVVWPSIRTPAQAGAMLACLYTLSDFGGVALFRYPVLTTAIQQAYGASFDRNYAAILAAILVVVALILFAIERRLRPTREFAVGRSRTRTRIRSRTVTAGAMVVILAAPVLAVGVPLSSVLLRLLNAQTVRALDPERLVSAATHTLLLAVGGAAIAVLLALPIALLSARYPGTIARILETAGSLPLAVPGIVVGLGLVFVSLFIVPALYQTAIVLALAYGILFLPKGIGAIRSSIERVPRSLEDIAATLGYGPLSRWRKVTARLARAGIVTATLFIAVTAMKELPATLMLRPTGMNTLAYELWTKTATSQYGAATPYALALVFVAALPAALLAPTDRRLSEHPRSAQRRKKLQRRKTA